MGRIAFAVGSFWCYDLRNFLLTDSSRDHQYEPSNIHLKDTQHQAAAEKARATPLTSTEIANFLKGDTPWAADTGLLAIDKNMAELMEGGGEFINSLAGLDSVWKDMLSCSPSGEFLKLAAKGNFLHASL